MAYNDITGVPFPLVLSNGRLATSDGLDLIKTSIINILSWPYLTRFFEIEYGSRINEVLEEQADATIQDLVYTFVIQSITRWEKRIKLSSVNISVKGSAIHCSLTYTVLRFNKTDNLSFNIYNSN